MNTEIILIGMNIITLAIGFVIGRAERRERKRRKMDENKNYLTEMFK